MGSPRSWCSSLVLPDRPRTSESHRPSFSASKAPGTFPSSTWRVQPGSYIAFSLQVSELAKYHAPDSNAAKALLTFQGGRYLGLVVGSYVTRSPDDTRWIEDLSVLFVSDLEPPFPEVAGHYVPIAPYQGVEPPPRKPITTKDMFPLKNRLQWTTFGTRLQIETLVESSLGFKMDDDEFNHFEAVVCADMAALRTLGNCPNWSDILKLKVPDCDAVPATVWRDIRGGHRDDPTQFVMELWS